jgi:heat shock protein HtpX
MNGNKILNNLKTTLLLAAMSGLILTIGVAMGGQGGLTIALIIALVMNFGAYFFSAKIALMSMQAQEVGPDHPLFRIVSDLAGRANLPMPKVYVSPQQAPNAFATGRNPKHAAVCATEGLLAMLNRNEVAGVMAHELAHVRHRDILITTIAATLGTVIQYVAQMFLWTGGASSDDDEGGGNPLGFVGVILMAILAPIAAGLIQMAISRQREYAADTEGAAICGDPMHLATALEKIHAAAHQVPMNAPPAMNALMIAEPLNAFGGGLSGLFQTHPPLEKRLQNLIGRETTGAVRFAH